MRPVLYQRARPSSLEGYVFVDSHMERKFKEWVANKDLPNIILTGSPGTGKTTLAYALCNELGVPSEDILYIRSTLANGIDTIRDKVVPFVELISHSEHGRVVILDEADKLSPSAQDGLRNIIEDCMEHARFIITGNYAHKITDALKSRCQVFHIESLDKNGYMLRVAETLVEEGINFDIETLQHYADKNYPDMRGIFNDVERFTFDGTLTIQTSESQIQHSEWMMTAIQNIMEGKYREAREAVCANIQYEEYGEFYRLMYENIDWWAKGDPSKQDKVIMTIKEHLVADNQVGDREIVLSACLTKLSLI